MRDESLFDALAESIRNPERTAIADTGRGEIRYGDLFARAARASAHLMGLGIRPGDRVAAQVEKSVEALVLYLATLRAGAIYLPLNTAYTLGELGYFLTDAEPALVVCDPARRDAIAPLAAAVKAKIETLGAAGEGSLTEGIRAQSGDLPPVARRSGDLAAILYTSGTTGRAKGAMLTHGNLLSNARTLVEAWRFTPADRLIHALPTYHTHGLFVACNTVLLSGGSMLFLPKFDAGEIHRLMPGATAMMGVPTYYVRLLSEPGLDRAAAAGMRLFVSGSAPLLAETHRGFAARTGHAILERYGMTETNMNTSNPYDGERIAGTVGPALPGISVRIVDRETSAPMPAGEIGMIEVKGPNVFAGYWRQPEKTRAEFRSDGFFITGDLGTIDGRGYVRIVGRGKDLIITGGLNVYPKEVESEIDAIPGVEESAVIGVPHGDLGEGVTAIVVHRANGPRPDEAAIIDALRDRLARFKQPKRILFVDALPRNAMGKVQKNELQRRYAGLYGAAEKPA